MGQLWQLGAADLAAAIRDRRASSREVVEAHLARMGSVNGEVRAITATLPEQALAAADAADRALARRRPVGLLHGVPLTVEENVDVAGSATTWGVPSLAEAVAAADAPPVACLKEEGAIPIGRTNLPDFALRWHTDSGLHGPTRNPWDPGLTPGGASGGEAAALATGMTPLGLGNDLGGSLRWPAQCCGTAAMRTTPGRAPNAPAIEPTEAPVGIQLVSSQGPIARHVRDLRLAFEALRRTERSERPSGPAASGAPAAGVRVAVVTDPSPGGVDPAVEAGIRRAADALRDGRYPVEELEPPDVAGAAQVWAQLVSVQIRKMEPVVRPLMSERAQEFLSRALEVLPAVDLALFASAAMRRDGLLRVWSQFLEEQPVILAPLSTSPPFPPDADLEPGRAAEILAGMRMSVAVSILGLPSVTVPVGTAGGLPQAVQVIAGRHREDLCLTAAEAIEDRLGVVTPIDPR